MPRPSALFAVSLVLLSGCTGTTLADRMPTAVETVMWGVERTREDLDSIGKGFRESADLNDESRILLGLEQKSIKQRLDRAAENLRRAEKEVDMDRLQAVVEEMPIMMERVSTLRRTVMIAEAAAKPR